MLTTTDKNATKISESERANLGHEQGRPIHTLCAQSSGAWTQGVSSRWYVEVFGVIERETDNTWLCVKSGKRVRKRKIVKTIASGRGKNRTYSTEMYVAGGGGHQPAIIFIGELTPIPNAAFTISLEDKEKKWFYAEDRRRLVERAPTSVASNDV